MELNLGAEQSSRPIDEFLRDMLRWRIGKNTGIGRSYEMLRKIDVLS